MICRAALLLQLNDVTRGLAEHEVAPAVAALGFDERHVAVNWVLQHSGPAVDDAPLLMRAVGVLHQFGAEAGARKEGADDDARRTQALDQLSLRHQLELNPLIAVEAVERVAVGLTQEGDVTLRARPALSSAASPVWRCCSSR